MLERLNRLFLPATPAEVDIAAPTASAPAAAEPVCSASLDTLVIDVRSEREFQATAIAHAVNVPLVLYCASGARSGGGCQQLKLRGYTNVTHAGGLHAAGERLQREVRR